jgi:uncharacterized protein (DUF302 family)
MLFKMETNKGFEQVCLDLEKAVVANKFGVMAIHNLNETMKKKGVEFSRLCRIFEVCNPLQAKKVLERNMDLSSFLPCRISIFMEGEKVFLATLKPTAIVSLFNLPDLKTTAQEVEDTLIKIMKEASVRPPFDKESLPNSPDGARQ